MLRAEVEKRPVWGNLQSAADSFVSAAEPIFTAAASPMISMGSGKALAQTYSASALMGKG